MLNKAYLNRTHARHGHGKRACPDCMDGLTPRQRRRTQRRVESVAARREEW